MYCKGCVRDRVCETDCTLKRACEINSYIHNWDINTNLGGREIPVHVLAEGLGTLRKDSGRELDISKI